MPRKKSTKTTKPKCTDAFLKEKIDSYQRGMQAAFIEMDILEEKNINIVDNHITTIKMGMSSELKQMKMGQFLQTLAELSRLSDYKASDHTRMLTSMSLGNKQIDGQNDGDTSNDSGLGKESSTSSNTKEPLQSARAQRSHRSRSAFNDRNGFNLAPLPLGSSTMVNGSHKSRRKMHPPMATRRMAFSADRNLLNTTSPVTFLRYPKSGENILSKSGSPMMAHTITKKFANINIPTRDGVLCLTSNELMGDEISTNLVKALDEDGLKQIRILHSNLQMIAEFALK